MIGGGRQKIILVRVKTLLYSLKTDCRYLNLCYLVQTLCCSPLTLLLLYYVPTYLGRPRWRGSSGINIGWVYVAYVPRKGRLHGPPGGGGRGRVRVGAGQQPGGHQGAEVRRQGATALRHHCKGAGRRGLGGGGGGILKYLKKLNTPPPTPPKTWVVIVVCKDF